MERRRDFLLASTLVAAGVGFFLIVVRNRERILSQLSKNFRNPLMRKKVSVIETLDECHQVMQIIKKHCNKFNVVGFDCEWVTVGGNRRPLALLQLSSHEGHCALFRLCCMKQIPKDLRELLENDNVIKVGVASNEDAQKLAHDYGVGVASTFDLRYLAMLTGHKPEGLGKLAQTHLRVKLDKSWRLACSDWEAKQLSPKQLEYAANDALVAVEIFKKLANQLQSRHFWEPTEKQYAEILQKLQPYLEVNFHQKFQSPNVAISKNTKKSIVRKQQVRGIGTQTKQFYDNSWLEAPDGELLCTIDRRKANWYVAQGLGQEIKSEPYTVRLNFEPAGRAVGEVGRFYQTPKENRCVVCGRTDVYIRKNIVPREYRKHFPEVMKEHSSHDVLLLCPMCHQTSNISDLKIRTKLASLCDAPFKFEDGAIKYYEVPRLKKVRSAARALLKNSQNIPANKVAEMRSLLLDYYPEITEITTELLKEAAHLEYKVENENYTQHGEKVVSKYRTELGGLLELEKVWREHFLHTMQPKFMPSLWSVNHNADRLEVRASEGRVDLEDLVIAGLEPPTS